MESRNKVTFQRNITCTKIYKNGPKESNTKLL